MDAANLFDSVSEPLHKDELILIKTSITQIAYCMSKKFCPFQIARLYIKMDKTSWTYNTNLKFNDNFNRICHGSGFGLDNLLDADPFLNTDPHQSYGTYPDLLRSWDRSKYGCM